MDIHGIGTEIIECLRVGRMIERHGEVFLQRIYTDREIRYCQSRRRATEHFTALWAVKEAVLKALGIRWRQGMEWTDVEVVHQLGSSPLETRGQARFEVVIVGALREAIGDLKLGKILVSLAHCRAYATAYVIALRE
jgi:holo-[acyl-carrier protein] synthase